MGEPYTPTTGQVQFAYIDQRFFKDDVAHIEHLTDAEYGAEFDRWLASVKAETLREAADQFVRDWTEVALGGATYVAGALHDRADRIKKEPDHD